MADELAGKVAAITGASSGIGEATAEALAAAGATVAIGARREERLDSLASRISDNGGKALPIAVDVMTRQARDRSSSGRTPSWAAWTSSSTTRA